MSLESAKKYGFISSVINSILPIVSIVVVVILFAQLAIQIPSGEPITFLIVSLIAFCCVIGVVSIAGFVLFFLSMHRLSEYYKEPKIFKNILYSLLLSIISAIIIVCVVIGFALSSSMSQSINSNTDIQTMWSFIGIYGAVVGITIVLAIINGVLYWQAFNKLGEKSGVDIFKTVGLLYLIGSLIMMPIILWIAWIIAAHAYKKLQPQPTLPTPTDTPTTTTLPIDKIYCSYCGTENISEAIYCKNCGNPLQTHQTEP